jgi:hypothetical protein
MNTLYTSALYAVLASKVSLPLLPRNIVDDLARERTRVENIVKNAFQCSCPFDGYNIRCLLEKHHYYCMVCTHPLNDRIQFGECGCVYHTSCIAEMEGVCASCSATRYKEPKKWIPVSREMQVLLNMERKEYAKRCLENNPEDYKFYVYDDWKHYDER